MTRPDPAYLLDEARRHDPDRALCALFAPAERRPGVLALLLLNHELARIPDVVTQPVAGMIRYQWWREAIAEAAAGRPRAHPVVQGLAPLLQGGAVAVADLEGMIDARAQELEGLAPDDRAALEAYAAATSGALQRATLRTLGGTEPPWPTAARDVGTAYALVGLARAVGWQAERQRRLLPRALLAEAAVAPEEIVARRMSEGLAAVIRVLTERAEALVAGARAHGRPPRAWLAALLPARLVDLYAAQLRRAGFDPFRADAVARPPLAAWRLTLAAAVGRF